MTSVMQFSNFSLQNVAAAGTLAEYMVEVINYDNESEIVYVEAHDESEAMELAAGMVDNADYAMVQGIFF